VEKIVFLVDKLIAEASFDFHENRTDYVKKISITRWKLHVSLKKTISIPEQEK